MAAPGPGQAYAYGMSGIECEQSTTVDTLRTFLYAAQLGENHCEHQNIAERSFQLEHRPGIELAMLGKMRPCHGIRDVILAAQHPIAASSFVTNTSMPVSLLA